MRHRTAPAAIGLLLALTACTSSSRTSKATVTAPVPTAPPTVTANVATSTSTTGTPTTTATTRTVASVATTTPPTAPPSTVTTAVLLPDGIGTKVNAAPGVNTPGDIRQLIPKMWVFIPSATDPNDNHVQPPRPGDIDIITAYIEEETAAYALIVQRPVPTVASPRLAAAQTASALAKAMEYYQGRAAAGDFYDLADGLVLRPVVIADPRSVTEAFIFDCVLDGSGWRKSDGSLAKGEVAGVKRSPQIARIVKVDGRWITDVVSTDDRVCA